MRAWAYIASFMSWHDRCLGMTDVRQIVVVARLTTEVHDTEASVECCGGKGMWKACMLASLFMSVSMGSWLCIACY
jgi:hypothetical protein